MEHFVLDLALVAGIFLAITTIVLLFSEKFSFPFTVALLITGFIGQFLVHTFHLDIHVTLSPDVIYYILLPILLFEGALKINYHQFRLHFKTISLVATFGLLVSVFVVGTLMAWLLGLPLNVALLFGALISATDPIAVLALFKRLGAPKRLGLLADGESMFNDATGVIAFRVFSAFVFVGNGFDTRYVWQGFGQFAYMFFGSMVFGLALGLITSIILGKLKEDFITKTVLLLGICFFSFVGAEHFFGFSGVISSVITAIIIGNLARTTISRESLHGLEKVWEVLGFISVSLVFFFATYNMNVEALLRDINSVLIIIPIILLARAASVYSSFAISNHAPGFKDEPNVPLAWQHIINWGGLRGVIPLVLAYSLPETFEYRDLFLNLTLGALLFTLFVNALSISWLLRKLGLHQPEKEQQIIEEELSLFELSEMRERLAAVPRQGDDKLCIEKIDKELAAEEEEHKDKLLKLLNTEELVRSLHIESLEIERETVQELYELGQINQRVYYTFEAELDLQEDALSYPDIYQGKFIDKDGKIKSNRTFRSRVLELRQNMKEFPILKTFLKESEESIVEERYSQLRARIITSTAVIEYLEKLQRLMKGHADIIDAIEEVKKSHEQFNKNNREHIDELMKEYPAIVQGYRERLFRALAKDPEKIVVV